MDQLQDLLFGGVNNRNTAPNGAQYISDGCSPSVLEIYAKLSALQGRNQNFTIHRFTWFFKFCAIYS
jgi:hypothetical protein